MLVRDYQATERVDKEAAPMLQTSLDPHDATLHSLIDCDFRSHFAHDRLRSSDSIDDGIDVRQLDLRHLTLEDGNAHVPAIALPKQLNRRDASQAVAARRDSL